MKAILRRFSLMAVMLAIAAVAVAQPPYYPRQPRVVVHQPVPMPEPPMSHRYYGVGQWHRTYYGFRLGLNASCVRSDAPALDGHDVKAGLNIGFAIGTQLSYTTPLFIESGLYYTQKGGKSNNAVTPEGMPSKFSYDLNYLQLPILFKYRHYLSNGVSIEPFVGGYLSCGVAGSVKDYGDRRATGSFDDRYFNRFDGGLKFGVGVGYGIAYGEVGYDLGLANIGQDAFDDTHNGCFTINVGVNF